MPKATVCGQDMFYRVAGNGDPILFLHGNPSSSFSWRKIIEKLQYQARCIAIDHIGFGESARPSNIPYSFFNHAEYFEAFVRQLRLENVTLVLQDWGSAIGFDYAVRNRNNVRGIAFCEAIIKPYESWNDFPTSGPDTAVRQLFKQFRNGEEGGPGWELIVKQNVFVERLLPNLLGVGSLSDVPKEYLTPFENEISRLPIWRFPKEIPIEGRPSDVHATVAKYSEALAKWDIPKLVIYSKVGATLQQEHVDWLHKNWNSNKSLTVFEIEGKVIPGSHFFQETHPDQFLNALLEWYRKLSQPK